MKKQSKINRLLSDIQWLSFKTENPKLSSKIDGLIKIAQENIEYANEEDGEEDTRNFLDVPSIEVALNRSDIKRNINPTTFAYLKELIDIMKIKEPIEKFNARFLTGEKIIFLRYSEAVDYLLNNDEVFYVFGAFKNYIKEISKFSKNHCPGEINVVDPNLVVGDCNYIINSIMVHENKLNKQFMKLNKSPEQCKDFYYEIKNMFQHKMSNDLNKKINEMMTFVLNKKDYKGQTKLPQFVDIYKNVLKVINDGKLDDYQALVNAGLPGLAIPGISSEADKLSSRSIEMFRKQVSTNSIFSEINNAILSKAVNPTGIDNNKIKEFYGEDVDQTQIKQNEERIAESILSPSYIITVSSFLYMLYRKLYNLSSAR